MKTVVQGGRRDAFRRYIGLAAQALRETGPQGKGLTQPLVGAKPTIASSGPHVPGS